MTSLDLLNPDFRDLLRFLCEEGVEFLAPHCNHSVSRSVTSSARTWWYRSASRLDGSIS